MTPNKNHKNLTFINPHVNIATEYNPDMNDNDKTASNQYKM